MGIFEEIDKKIIFLDGGKRVDAKSAYIDSGLFDGQRGRDFLKAAERRVNKIKSIPEKDSKPLFCFECSEKVNISLISKVNEPSFLSASYTLNDEHKEDFLKATDLLLKRNYQILYTNQIDSYVFVYGLGRKATNELYERNNEVVNQASFLEGLHAETASQIEEHHSAFCKDTFGAYIQNLREVMKILIRERSETEDGLSRKLDVGLLKKMLVTSVGLSEFSQKSKGLSNKDLEGVFEKASISIEETLLNQIETLFTQNEFLAARNKGAAKKLRKLSVGDLKLIRKCVENKISKSDIYYLVNLNYQTLQKLEKSEAFFNNAAIDVWIEAFLLEERLPRRGQEKDSKLIRNFKKVCKEEIANKVFE